MTRKAELLIAAEREWRDRQRASVFSTKSADLRGYEPKPTIEIVRGEKIPSMYETIRRQMDGDPWAPTPAQGKLSVF